LAALSQQTPLKAFRLIVAEAPDGLPAGEIARRLDVPQNTMSSHLATLSECGLVRGERRLRQVLCRADLDRFRALIIFLLQDCCGRRPEICAAVLQLPMPCYPPAAIEKVKFDA
jgi:DNA-binding transcriptional ArsR family regulator